MKKNRKIHHAGRIISLLLVLCMTMAFLPTTAFAKNGPSTGEYSYAWVRICIEKENGEFSGYNIWRRDGKDIETVQGVSYSEETNTLTLSDVNMPDYCLLTNEMGDDFKVELVGDNHLLYLYAYGYGWGGSVELTGNGSLTLNEKKVAKCTPVTLCAEYTNAAFVVDSTVTLTIHKKSGNPNIVENTMTALSENAIQFKGKTEDVGITTEEIQKYKTLPVFYTVSEYPSTYNEYYTKDDDGKTYVISKFYSVDENGEVTDKASWVVYGVVEVDHPTVTTGKVLVTVKTLYDDPTTQGYTKHDGEISANSLGNGSSSIQIVKNTATGKEYAYVIDWINNTYTLHELVAELEGFDGGWNQGNIWYAVPAEPKVTGSIYDELPAGYEFITLGGSGFFVHTATGGSGDVFTQTPSEITPPAKDTVTELTDSKSGVKVKFTNGIAESSELRVTPVTAEITDIDNLLAVYDISVYQNGTIVPISGNKMEIRIPLSENMKGYKYYQVAYLKDGAIKERFDVTVDGDTLVFETDYLGEYAVLGSNTQFANGVHTGDADLDGSLTIIDATYIQRYLASIIKFNDTQMSNADYDNDGKVTIIDATSIQRTLAGLD